MPGRSRAAHVLLLCVACDGFVVPRNRRAFVQQRNQVRMMSDPEQIEKLQEQAAKLREEVAAMEAEVRANRKPEPERASARVRARPAHVALKERRRCVSLAVFPCFGVVPTMRHAGVMLPPKPRAKLEATLGVIDRHDPASSGGRRTIR